MTFRIAVALLSLALSPARAACDRPPLFAMDGPACAAADQLAECRCSECMSWDDTPTATWYEVLRRNPDATTVNVGNTSARNRSAYVDDEGGVHPAIYPTLWCVAWDVPFPAAGQLYTYQIRACNSIGCGPWSATTLQHRATAYWCGRGYCNGGRTP